MTENKDFKNPWVYESFMNNESQLNKNEGYNKIESARPKTENINPFILYQKPKLV